METLQNIILTYWVFWGFFWLIEKLTKTSYQPGLICDWLDDHYYLAQTTTYSTVIALICSLICMVFKIWGVY